MLISAKVQKKILKKQKRKEKRFRFFKLRKIRKTILKFYEKILSHNNGSEVPETIIMFPEDFKRLSNEEIEFGLDILVKLNDILEWKKTTKADGTAFQITHAKVSGNLTKKTKEKITYEDRIVKTKKTKEKKDTINNQISLIANEEIEEEAL